MTVMASVLLRDVRLMALAVHFVSWLDAAIQVATLLREGLYASHDKIDPARENEFRELSETLWKLRHDLSD